MTSTNEQLDYIEAEAIKIAGTANPTERHKRGFWLHNELVNLDNGILTSEQLIRHRALIKLMLEVIFVDAVEQKPR